MTTPNQNVTQTVTPGAHAGATPAAPAQTVTQTVTVEFRIVPLDGPGQYARKVAGTSHRQDILESVVGGRTKKGANHECRAVLVREPANKYDPNATLVTIEGKVVGYLNRVDALELRPTLAALWERGMVASVPAKVTGGWERPRAIERGAEGLGHFGVSVDVG